MYNREYARTVSQWQLDWLKKDLQQVTDKSTPIVAYFHVPVHKPSISLNNTRFVTDVTGTNNITNATAFSQLFSEFSDVHFVSGHTHRNNPISNSKMPAGRQNIDEHNAASVGGTWWWSGRLSSVNVGTDGTPGGYKVFDISNKSINWYYKSFAKNKDYQFRAFDMNKVKAELGKSTYDGFYSSTGANKDRYTWAAANSVLVNVFSWDQDWTIEVEENGSKLAAGKVRQVRANDPLHVLAYALPRYTMSGASAGFMTEPTHHMFYIEPANGTSTLKITVTDNFGNKYIENMTRPKDFNVNMY